MKDMDLQIEEYNEPQTEQIKNSILGQVINLKISN